jgi:hypothetical protein
VRPILAEIPTIENPKAKSSAGRLSLPSRKILVPRAPGRICAQHRLVMMANAVEGLGCRRFVANGRTSVSCCNPRVAAVSVWYWPLILGTPLIIPRMLYSIRVRAIRKQSHNNGHPATDKKSNLDPRCDCATRNRGMRIHPDRKLLVKHTSDGRTRSSAGP